MLLLLLVPEQRGKYPNVGVGVGVVGVGVGVGVGGYPGVGAIKAGSAPCCWYRRHKSGVGALLGGAFLKEKPKLLKF